MTRRAFARAGKVLSLNEYISRATLGLPKTERLDAAAELRAHLLEQVAVLEAKGFAREEAEFLAVQAMGDPLVTNRQLLGHLLTNPLGWGVLGVVMLGLGGWWASENLKPVGLRPSVIVQTDYVALSHTLTDQWPHGSFDSLTRAAEIRFPKGTKTVFAAFTSYENSKVRPWIALPLPMSFGLSSFGSLGNNDNFDYASAFRQGHFRMVATAAPQIGDPTPRCAKDQLMLGSFMYSTDKLKLPKGVFNNVNDGIYGFENIMGGLCVEQLGNSIEINSSPLTLNSWSKAYQIFGFPDINGKQSKQQMAYALLLFPTDRQITKPTDLPQPEKAFTYNPKSYQWEPIQP